MGRLCNIKLRTFGGLVSVISAYAAPNYDHNLDARVEFFHKLSEFVKNCKTHGPTYVLGDFNARLFKRFSYEEAVIGPYLFDCPHATLTDNSNREFLFEMCHS